MARITRLLTICIALALAVAPAATASEARVSDGVLRVTAAPGEGNDLLVSSAGDELAVSDLGTAPEAGPGCTPDGDAVLCRGAGSIVVLLGDGDDSANVDLAVTVPATFEGGAGSDSVGAGGGPSTLRGGAGDDFLGGGDGDDAIDAGAGLDYVVGGGGNDTIATRDGAEDSVACGDGPDAAAADAQDAVDPDCEAVTRSSGEPPPPPPSGGAGSGGSEPGSSPGQAEGGGRAPAIRRRPRDFAWCSTHGSRTTLLCSVRLLRRHPNGELNLTLRSGAVVFATGRGRIVRGIARVRLRTHRPVVGGRYVLRAVVDRGNRFNALTRSLGVDMLRGSAVR